MAIAKIVRDVEPSSLEWLNIEDTDGNVWRYARKGNADPDASVDVDGEFQGNTIRAVLVRGADGTAMLRQDGPGLPEKIVVDYVSPAPPGPLPMVVFWKGKVQFEQEPET